MGRYDNLSNMNGYEIKELPGKGRAMIATKAFAEGDIIFEEEPFVSVQCSWNADYGYAACDHCMRPLETVKENVTRLSKNPNIVLPYLNYDPTLKCIEQFTKCKFCAVRYCSEDCRFEAFNNYHRVLCLGAFKDDDTHPINILNQTWKNVHYPPETNSIMLIARLMAKYQQSNNKPEFIEQIKSFQSGFVNYEEQIYHKMLGEHFEKDLEQLYAAFTNAFSSEIFSEFTTPTAFKSLICLIGKNSQGNATSVLAEWDKIITALPKSDQEEILLDQQMKYIYDEVEKVAGEYLNNEGVGLYLSQSKINHSCVPNAHSTFPYSNNIFVLRAIKPIEVGEEICISYIEECLLNSSRHSRHNMLKANYIFTCTCAKCLEQANDPDETSEDEMDFDDDDEDMVE